MRSLVFLPLLLVACGSRPVVATQADCRPGQPDGCAPLAEEWAGRELATGELAQRGRDALPKLREACDKGAHASACFTTALMLKYGTGGDKDPEASKTYFAMMRKLGDIRGFRGEPPSPEGAKVLGIVRAACDKGDRDSCLQVAWAAFSAVQQDKDVRLANTAWMKACELGSGTGCRWAGHLSYSYPEVGGDPARTRRLLERACALAPAGGCDELGLFLEHRQDDAKTAAPLYEKSCEDGSRAGCLHAAYLVLDQTLPGGEPRARELLQVSCDAGEKEACERLTRLDVAPGSDP
jgi:uncharacterized protein